MLMNKRGLSAVVTTVIVILLAIVAITIVWNFVKPTIEGAGSSIEILSKDSKLKVKKAETTSPGNIDVVIERGGTQIQI
jgi:anionic cell wall polymer biosynthesis LytR-Cps2A-Psr (LCP) family protein